MTSVRHPRGRRGQLPARVEVVVVGGGALGASVAFHLAEDGIDVLLVEACELASGSAGQLIGGVRKPVTNPADAALAARSQELYADFTNRPGLVRGHSGGDNQPGDLFLLPDAEDVTLFEKTVARHNEHGLQSRMLSHDAAQRLNPYIHMERYAGAAYTTRDWFTDAQAVVEGYVAGVERHGGQVRTHITVTGLEMRNSQLVAAWTNRGRVRTGAVVLCPGAWSAKLAAAVGLNLPVKTYRRLMGLTPPLNPTPPRIPFTIDYGSTFYFHHADPGGLVLGIADPVRPLAFDRTNNPDWISPLRGDIATCAPRLVDVPVARGWAGLYEMTLDRHALIGEATGLPGRVLYAMGFSGHGCSRAPAVGEAVRDLYVGRTPQIDISGFSGDRLHAS